MFSSIIKVKHALAGVVKGTRAGISSHKTFKISKNTSQTRFSSSSVNSFSACESVVSLDVSEVEACESEHKNENQKYGRMKKISELENKYLKKKEENPTTESSAPGYKYVESLKKNEEFFRRCILQLSSKKRRKKEEKILIDNKKIIRDAMSAGFQPSTIFFSRTSDLESLQLDPSVKLCKISYKQIQLWSNVACSQGVVDNKISKGSKVSENVGVTGNNGFKSLKGLFDRPSALSKMKAETSGTLPLTVICDDIRDPGNMGSVLRVAAAVGCKKLILTKDCVDIWDPKVIRSAAGAHFQFPYLYDMEWESIEKEIPEECKLVLADFNSCTDSCNTENLNDENEDSKKYVKDNLPMESYSCVSFGKQDVVIVIGNEAVGLSKSAYLLANRKKGQKVFIPMSNGINSLNSAVALGILLYEVRRQIEKLSNG